MFEKHKKESPFLSVLGLGGGVGSKLVGGGGIVSDGTMTFALFGGGGSGGGWGGGGGGGGGYVEEDEGFSKSTPYAFTIGAAGATPGPGPSTPELNHKGNDGGNTTLVTNSGTFTAYGGGGGNSVPQGINGLGGPGGSGGGGYNPSSPPGGGLGNAVTGTTNPAQASPPQPKVLSRVQGYPGGDGAAGDGMFSGGGGANGAGSNASPSQGGNGGGAVTTTNFGPHNGTYGGGGGGSATHGLPGGTGGGSAGDGVMTNETAKNASGYANGGGGTREAGHPGGAATAGLILIRVPDAFDTSITNGGANQVVTGGYRYIRLTAPGTITFVDA